MISFSLFLLNCLGAAWLIDAWLNSEAFVEYMELFGLKRLFHIREYLELKKDNFPQNYLGFLQEYFDNFFVRLVSCAICLSFWLGLLNDTLTCALLGDFSAFVFLVLPSAFFTLLFYRILNKLA